MAEPSRTQQTDGRNLLIWVLVLASVLALALLQPLFPDIKAYPVAWTLPVTDWLNIGMDWVVGAFKPVFRALSALMHYPLQWISAFLGWLPWSVGTVIAVMIGYRAGGWPLATKTSETNAHDKRTTRPRKTLHAATARHARPP